MRIEQLEYLHAITRLGSMRRAGEALHISQPALSEAVRNLERELGVTLLERRRSGARMSAAGREMLPFMTDVLDAVERLRGAADEQHRSSRVLRIGTVNAATVGIVAPAIREFREAHADTQVELVSLQHAEIHDALLEGAIDLGLVNLMRGDDVPPELETTELLRGRAVLCCRHDDELATREAVTTEEILARSFVFMRSGYVMYRYVHRLFGGRRPGASYSADGAEMGKLMVAEGLGVTVLPDYSVADDPMVTAGTLVCRPLASDDSAVVLVLHRRRARHVPPAAVDLAAALVRRAGTFAA